MIGNAYRFHESQIITLPMKSTLNEDITYHPDVFQQDLAKVKELYNKLPELKITKIQLAKEVYYSCAMEGAVSTVAKSIKLLTDDTSKPADISEQMIYNYLKLINNQPGEILFKDIRQIRYIWDILSKDAITAIDDGYPFRSGPVYIEQGGKRVHEGLKSDLIEEYLEILYRYLEESEEDSIIKALILHFFLEHYHVFADCNGRTGRFIMTEYLSHTGYDKFKALPINYIIYKQKLEYDYSLRIYTNPNIQTHSIDHYLEYMLKVLRIASLMSLYLNTERGDKLNKYLISIGSEVLPNDTPLNILQTLDDEELIDSASSQFNLRIIAELGTAIRLYHMQNS